MGDSSEHGDIITRTESHAAASKMALVAENIDELSEPDWQQQLKSAVEAVRHRPDPKSCAVIIEMLDEISGASPCLTPKSVSAMPTITERSTAAASESHTVTPTPTVIGCLDPGPGHGPLLSLTIEP